MNMRLVTSALIVSLVAGCATVNTVSSSRDEYAIPTSSMIPKPPYPLVQDYGALVGAKRTLSIDGTDVKVAATLDGKTVLIMDAHPILNGLQEPPFMLNFPIHSEAVNNGCLAVQKVLHDNRVEILMTRPIMEMGDIDGYVLELASDGYSVLKGYTK